jgi:hypothetical protein
VARSKQPKGTGVASDADLVEAPHTIIDVSPEALRGDDTEAVLAEPETIADTAVLPDSEIAQEEPAPEPDSSHTPEPRPEPLKPVPQRRGGFLPMLLGGAAAAGIGAGAVLYLLPEGWRKAGPDATQTAILETVGAQDAAIQGLTDEIAALKTAQADFAATKAAAAALADQLAATEAVAQANTTALSDAKAQIDAANVALEARLAELEKRPVDGGAASDTALGAFERDLTAMRTLLAERRAATEARVAEVEAAASTAAQQIAAAEAKAAAMAEAAETTAKSSAAKAAVSHLQAALATGEPLDQALAELATAGIPVPADLAASAAGTLSLADLQARFPDAARRALTASAKATAEGGGIGAFLKTQTGARSLEPRAGDDPDAVLSRTEALLKAGDLKAAISEMQGLPEAGLAAMAEWQRAAEARLAVADAVAQIAQSVE